MSCHDFKSESDLLSSSWLIAGLVVALLVELVKSMLVIVTVFG
jgi:hypothetical protein